MNQKRKRLMCLLAAGTVTLGTLPAFALTSEQGDGYTLVVHAGDGGKCGEKLEWSWTSANNILEITGEGEMTHYDYPEDRPYHSLAGDIVALSLPVEMTGIGQSAFREFTNLKSATLPKNIEYIGAWAFFNCTSLESLEIPESVKWIGQAAFYNCPLPQIHIPSGMTEILKGTFAGAAIKSITIPENITRIGEVAFSETTNLKDVYIMNAECEIFDDILTFGTDNGKKQRAFSGTIYGYKNSTAQTYAKKYGIKFEEIADWKTLSDQVAAGGIVELDRNYVAGNDDTWITVPEGVSTTLDLNGHTIDRGLFGTSVSEPDGGIFMIEKDASLKIIDSTGGGIITGANVKANSAIVNSGNLEINGGIFEYNVSNLTTGGCIVTGNNGKLVINDGTFRKNEGAGGVISVFDSEVTINGGTFTDNHSIGHGGVLDCDSEDGYVTVNGGTFTGNYSDTVGSAFHGYHLTLNGGTITGNTAKMYNAIEARDLKINGGIVKDNFSELQGISEKEADWNKACTDVMIYATKLSQVFGPDLAENTDIVFASDGGEVVYYDHYLYQPERGKKCQEWALNSGKVTDPDYLDKLHLASDDYKLTIVDGYVYTKERSETKYLVSFEGAGASGEMNSIYVDSDEMFRFPECAFETPSYYRFAGWIISGIPTVYHVGDKVEVTESITVKPYWKVDGLTLHYDANGGEGEMKDAQLISGTEYIFPKCQYTAPQGEVFVGWRIQGGKFNYDSIYQPGDTFLPKEDVTIIPLWEEEMYSVFFNGNGGEGEMQGIVLAVGTEITLGKCKFTAPEGTTFVGWQIGDSMYDPGDTYVISGDTEIKAIWSEPKEMLLLGDCDHNGVVDNADAMLLTRYVNGWEGIELDLDAADIDRDGDVTLRDAMILTRYVNAWEGYDEYIKEIEK